MNHHSSYSAPRSERSLSGGSSYSPRGGRNKKRNSYPKRSWKDNRVLFTMVCIVLPLVVLNLFIFFLATSTPRVELTVGDTKDYKSLDISIKVKSLLPVKSLKVTLESNEVELERNKNTYTATLTSNGVLEIQATGWNGMSAAPIYEAISPLDDSFPTVDENYTIENDVLTIVVDDSQSGVDYAGIYGVDANKQNVKPLSADAESGIVTLPMTTDSLTVPSHFLSHAAYTAVRKIPSDRR